MRILSCALLGLFCVTAMPVFSGGQRTITYSEDDSLEELHRKRLSKQAEIKRYKREAQRIVHINRGDAYRFQTKVRRAQEELRIIEARIKAVEGNS